MIDPFGPRNFPPAHLEPRQSQTRPPSDYENLLADALERAFGAGVWTLPEIVADLNENGVRAPAGERWTEATLAAELTRLGG